MAEFKDCVVQPQLGADAHVRAGAILLLVGAMGSAADAVFHLLAFAMTASPPAGADLVALMQTMQGPELRFILPLIAAFFVGSAWLSVALARRGAVSVGNPACYALALAVGVVGGSLAPRVGLFARAVGLAVLGLVAGAQAWAGLAIGYSPEGRAAGRRTPG
jgi:hypothetical protein